jgi:hypothetical protein
MTSSDVEILVRELMRGNRIDGVRFVDRLLLLASGAGEVRCVPVGDDRLRFTVAAEAPFEIDLDRARGKLRMVCARLAVLCSGEAAPALYGGQGTIAVGANADLGDGKNGKDRAVVKVDFANTPGDVRFTLQGQGRPIAPAREPEQLHA